MADTAATVRFAVTGIDHVVLRIADLDRALAFYRDVLGCHVEREQREIGLTQVRAGSSLIDLVTLDGELGRRGGGPPRSDARNVDHFCIGIRPYNEPALRAHLAAYGVEIVDAGMRYGATGEGPSLYVRDPDGNVLELKSVG